MEPTARSDMIRGVRDLARRRGWHAVEELASELLSSRGRETVLMLPGGGADAVPLQAWIQQLTAGERIAQVDLVRLRATPHRALFARKLIAVFDCGRPLPAAQVLTLLAQFRSRPREALAIVFTRADRLERRDDLELMERTIWRVFAPGPDKDWRGQDVIGCQCYLWTSGTPREFLRERCNRDRARLAAMVRRHPGEADAAALQDLQVTRLLELASAHCNSGARHGDADLSGMRRRCDEIAQLRRRLARRLECSVFEVARAAVAALLQSQREILQCVEAACSNPVAARKIARALSIGAVEGLMCPPPLAAALCAWHKRLQAELNERLSAVSAEVRELLRQAHVRLPGDGASAGRDRPAAATEDESIEVRLGALEYRKLTQVDPGRVDGLVAAEIGALALVGMTALSPGAFAAFIVSAVLSASLAIHSTQRTLEHSRRLVRLSVRDVTERAVPEVRGAVQAAIRGYRERLMESLREVELELEGACDRARLSQHAAPLDMIDHRQLLEYRCRL